MGRFPLFGLALFSPQHSAFILISVCFTAFLVYIDLYKKISKNHMILQFQLLAISTIIWVFLNRVVDIKKNASLWYIIPNSICSISAFVLAVATLCLKPTNDIFQIVPIVMIIGGLGNVFFPAYIGESDSIFFPNTITSLMYHVLAMDLAILEFVTGYIKMDKSRWFIPPIGLICYELYGFLIIKLTPLDDALNIIYPVIPNTKFTSPLIMFVMGVFYLLCVLVSHEKSKVRDKLFEDARLKK